jgi:hypothetical protein
VSKKWGPLHGSVIRFAGTKAVISVGLTNVVCNGELFQYATVTGVNPAPFTVKLKAGLPRLHCPESAN